MSRLWRGIVGLSVSYAAMTGRLPELEGSEAILTELVGTEPDPRAIDAYFALGFANLGRAEMDEAAQWFERTAVAVAPIDGNLHRQALLTAGACRAYDNDPLAALELYDQARRVPPPAQGWFEDYVAVFEGSARVQRGDLGDDRNRELGAMDRALTNLVELGLGFRITVAVHQAAVAFELADATDLLDYWWPPALLLARKNGHRWATALAVEVAGWSSARAQADERAVAHWAVADRVFQDSGFALSAVHRSASERHRQEVSERLGSARFAELYESARNVDLAVHIDQIDQT